MEYHTALTDTKIVTGRIVDKLLDLAGSCLVEKISFPHGLRYRVRIQRPGETSAIDVHIVNKSDKLFIELWLPNHAAPVLVLERDFKADVDSLVKEIVNVIAILTRGAVARGQIERKHGLSSSSKSA